LLKITLQKDRRCSGCGRCIAICREGVFSLDIDEVRKVVRIVSPEKCNYCGKCEENCVTGIIELKEQGDVGN
jgi:NAD-dependent dihydropyrimidine dehydrogenase PreA subunit